MKRVLFTHLPHSAMLHRDPRSNLGRILQPPGRSTCGCHGNGNRSLCFIKWLQGMTKHTWAPGVKDVRSGYDLFTEPPAGVIFFIYFWFKLRWIAQNKAVMYAFSRVRLSQTRPGLSLPQSAATLDKLVKKMAARGFLPAARSPCTVFG